MGKKKSKAPDNRGFATTSVKSAAKVKEEQDAVAAKAKAEAEAKEQAEKERQEELERERRRELGEEQEDDQAEAAPAAAEEDAVAARCREELAKPQKTRDLPPCLRPSQKPTAKGRLHFDRESERRVDAALFGEDSDRTVLRDPGDLSFPKTWRYKKLTFERLNETYLTLESLGFTAEHIALAMRATHGFDVRASLDWLCLAIPMAELPRSVGGDRDPNDKNFQPPSRKAETKEAETKEAEAKEAEATEAKAEEAEPANDAPDGDKDDDDEDGGWEAEADGAPRSPLGSDDAEDEAKPGDDKKASDEDGSEPPLSRQGSAEKPKDKPKKDKKDKEKKDMKSWILGYAQGDSGDSDPEPEVKEDPSEQYLKLAKTANSLMREVNRLRIRKKASLVGADINKEVLRMKEVNAALKKVRDDMKLFEDGKKGVIDWPRIRKLLQADDHLEKVANKRAELHALRELNAEQEAAKEQELDDNVNILDTDIPAGECDGGPPIQDFTYKNWNGKTPKQTLVENLRKARKVPIYHRAAGLGRCVIELQLDSKKTSTKDYPTKTWAEAENVAALLKLFELYPGRALARGFPPPFRDLWWNLEQESKQQEEQRRVQSMRPRIELCCTLLNEPVIEEEQRDAGLEAAFDQDAEETYTMGSSEEWEKRRKRCIDDPSWCEIQEQRESLPVTRMRHELTEAIRSHTVVIVAGSTGSGKTTQVPQFVLEDGMVYEEPVSIVVTEPRRISAMSVAQRVSAELGDRGLNDAWCGYHIRLERRVGPRTRLCYMTTGVLLRKLVADPILSTITHVFVDEVHERSSEMDLLAVLLKRLNMQGDSRRKRPLKIIVMSATLDTVKLSSYFGSDKHVPVITVPGRTFPVQAYFLEDIIEQSGYHPEADSWYLKRHWQVRKDVKLQYGGQTHTHTMAEEEVVEESTRPDLDDAGDGYSDRTREVLAAIDHTCVNYDLIEATIELIRLQYDDPSDPERGSILVFLPGMPEISKLKDLLDRSPVFGVSEDYTILPLHSSLTTEEHQRVFLPPRPGAMKIVLSTNIAETGITIPDVVFVIDACRVKQQRYREATSTSSLVEQFISQSEAKQRRGRAGRVRPGVGFHLCTERRFNSLPVHPIPEMLRCSLTHLALSVLASGLQPLAILKECLDPPPAGRIDEALAALRNVGAVIDHITPTQTLLRITALGQKLAQLPCDVGMGRFLVYASALGCVEPALTIVACLSDKTPFQQPFSERKRIEARNEHRRFESNPPSDHIAFVNVFDAWHKKGGDRWCRQHFLSVPTLRMVDQTRQDLKRTLVAANVIAPGKGVLSTCLASLVAGSGNVAKVDTPSTAGDMRPTYYVGQERVWLHPTSFLCGEDANRYQDQHWLVYHAKLRTKKLFLKDASFVTPMAVALFGKEIVAYPRECIVTLGGYWQAMYASYRTAALLRQLRNKVERCVRTRITSGKPAPDERNIIKLVDYLCALPPIPS